MITSSFDFSIGEKFCAAVISDFHLSKDDSIMHNALQIINKKKPDAVVLLGDFITFKKDNIDMLNVFGKIRCKNKFAVLGNHDYGMHFTFQKPNERIAQMITEKLESYGINVLRNESITFHDVNLVGVESVWAKKFDLIKAYSNTDNSKPVILLSHNPDIVLNLKSKYKTDLILSGHTHGYTFRLPKIGPIFPIYNTKLGRKADKGLKKYNERDMFITSGIGNMPFTPRIFNPPEIVFFEFY